MSIVEVVPAVLIASGMLALWLIWMFIVRVIYHRRFYEKQGIKFIDSCHVVLGAEIQVARLAQENKSHDWLYKNGKTGLVGTIRGCSVQLLATTPEVASKLIHTMGHQVDRDTPALFSFGRLSPFAITFTPASEPFFRQRKLSLTRALTDSDRLFDITLQTAEQFIHKFQLKNGCGQEFDVKEMLSLWTRETSGKFIWGEGVINKRVSIRNRDDKMEEMNLMTALNKTFTDLRFYSNKFWNRLYFPLSAWPITGEARRLNFNIKIVRKELDAMMDHPEQGSVAEEVLMHNAKLGIPQNMTRDDLVTATVAGFDTVKSTTMGTLWHLLHANNMKWRRDVLQEILPIMNNRGELDNVLRYSQLAQCKILNSVIYETLRFEPPGSLINNIAVKDFQLSTGDITYSIKAGTRIVSSIHALHQNEEVWTRQKTTHDENDVLKFNPDRFLDRSDEIIGSNYFMPFGKGIRRCPGQGLGLLMVRTFVAALLVHNTNCQIITPIGQTDETTHFNILSRASFTIRCSSEK